MKNLKLSTVSKHRIYQNDKWLTQLHPKRCLHSEQNVLVIMESILLTDENILLIDFGDFPHRLCTRCGIYHFAMSVNDGQSRGLHVCAKKNVVWYTCVGACWLVWLCHSPSAHAANFSLVAITCFTQVSQLNFLNCYV